MTFYSMFRHLGVVGGALRPWQMHASCGEFVAEGDVADDPAGVSAYFMKERGLTANIWQVERALARGFAKLRESGQVELGPDGEMDGSEAFAWLVSQRIANQVWREVMGYPFQGQPVEMRPEWRLANDRAAVVLAQAIYEERAFERMPILGDALEDAGCADAALLEHYRGRGEHVRRCWVVDLVLGKE